MLQVHSKYSLTGTTIFSVMSALAQEYQAVNLSQGFPDFYPDESLSELLREASATGYNQYAPMAGLPMLKSAIARRWQADRNIDIYEDEMTITPGATYAIYAAFTAILQPGDEVIVFEPAYDSYIPNIEMNGAVAITIPLTFPDFSIDWNRVKEAITGKTRAIIVTTPHNPTGTVLSAADWEVLATLTRNTDIIVISDEVYDELVYDGRQHCSILSNEELRSRSFAMFSFGKSLHITGWKVGYAVAPPVLTTAFRRVHQFLCFSVNTPAQYAIAKVLEMPGRTTAAQLLEERRDYFLSLMQDLPFQLWAPSAGSYFQLAGYKGISSLPDDEFAIWLTKEYGVATIPLSAFYRDRTDNQLIRFCFAKKKETLATAAERLRRLASR